MVYDEARTRRRCDHNDMKKAIVFHIPHASTVIPPGLRQSILLSEAELRSEILFMTDLFTDEIFGAAVREGDAVVGFPVSRLVLDPERFVDDTKEPMAARGMGVVYLNGHDGRILRPNLDDKQILVEDYYVPHHATLTRAVDQQLAKFGEAMIVDCHSFPSVPLPYELNQNLKRPQICIGTDVFHTPSLMSLTLADSFTKLGYGVGINEPFAGTIVPEKYFRRAKGVRSIMIELRRDLYMDESSGGFLPIGRELAKDVAQAINSVR
jgi:N-formylglutamate deformylase